MKRMKPSYITINGLPDSRSSVLVLSLGNDNKEFASIAKANSLDLTKPIIVRFTQWQGDVIDSKRIILFTFGINNGDYILGIEQMKADRSDLSLMPTSDFDALEIHLNQGKENSYIYLEYDTAYSKVTDISVDLPIADHDSFSFGFEL